MISVDGPGADYAAWRDAALPLDPHPVRPEDPVSIVYTSGTTGPPKGAVLTHGGVLSNVENYLADWDLRRDDATLVVNPIFHVVLYILTVPLLYKGGKVVLMEDFDAGRGGAPRRGRGDHRLVRDPDRLADDAGDAGAGGSSTPHGCASSAPAARPARSR